MPHVVVIGAGVAGQSAARLLSHQKGFTVTLLEATGRVGGRIKSVGVGTDTVDLGASWMHSIRENPLFDEGLKQGWPMGFTDNVVGYYTESGRVDRAAGVLPILEELRLMIAEDYHQEKPLKPETSLKSYIEAALRDMPLITPEQALLASLMSKQTEHFIGQPWHEIPASEGGNPNELGRNAFVFGKGYNYVLEWLHATTNWPNVELKLNEEVESIVMCPENPKFCLYSTTKNEYRADYVICTIPLGALKTTYAELFTKLPLPDGLVQAIARTDVAALGKVVLRFEEPFWDTLEQELLVVHSETQEVFSIVNPFGRHSATLIVLMGPPVTKNVEANPAVAFETVKWALQAIRINPERPVPQPSECIVTSWSQMPQIKGSYSARSIGQGYNEMVQPFIDGHGALRFAGEHTTFDGNGCVHGAYLSGIREAEYICENSHDCN